MIRNSASLLLTLLVSVTACDVTSTPDANPAQASQSISIMTFNVENLFDNTDDPGKDDRTYLSLSAKQSDEHQAACARIDVDRWRDQCLNFDWNDQIVDKKLAAVASAILQVDDGKGPDIVALQEVENIHILERLRNDYLADSGYLPGILIEGRDGRGIDVAFLSKLKLASDPHLHDLSFTGEHADREADTRGILQADFELPDGQVLTGFSVHFPAPYHPTSMRIDAYNLLNELAESLPADRPRFAAGDFNTTSKEDFEKDMLERFARTHWTVAHDLGCGRCEGTQYFSPDKSWSFLDMILWSSGEKRGENTTWQLRETSVRIANRSSEQVRNDGTPKRFSLPSGTGVSDHWPMTVSIELK